ncbi:hypothetical protein [Marinilactibacillus psychrotolerans]|uniref:hypothetical protein n=1 Tax=Marinilactibacillus psychrotolerans TaxID=191770 RepID=UPI003886D2F7
MDKNRYKRWTQEDDDYLESLSIDPEGEKLQSVADFLGRSRNSVVSRLVNMRKIHKHVGYLERKWTDREDSILINSKRNMSYKEIGELLNRTEAAVTFRAQRIGITKSITSAESLKKLEGTIRKLAEEGYTRREIAEKLNLDYMVIKAFVYNHKIKCRSAYKGPTEETKKNHQEFMSKAYRRYK